MTKERLEEIAEYLDYINAIAIKYNTVNKTTQTYEIARELLKEVVYLQDVLQKLHYLEE